MGFEKDRIEAKSSLQARRSRVEGDEAPAASEYKATEMPPPPLKECQRHCTKLHMVVQIPGG